MEANQDLIFLFLNLHPLRRLPYNAWRFLCAADLLKLNVLSKTIRSELKEIDYVHCCNSRRDYRVPFPGFPGLNLKPINASPLEGTGGLFQHQLASLQAIHRLENKEQEFGALRGGILADAPGLGKTITILALICSTAGRRPVSPVEFWDTETIQEHWESFRLNPESRAAMLKALKPVRMALQRRSKQALPYHGGERELQHLQVYKQLELHVTPPYEDDRHATIDSVIRHVVQSLQSFVPLAELELFRQNMIILKSELDPRNRRLLRSEAGRRLSMERSLIVTSATLIVVPDALLEHWFEQISSNLILDVFSDDIGQQSMAGTQRYVVYLDGLGDLADVANSTTALQNVNYGKDALPAWELSRYFIVITSFSRCAREYSHLSRKRKHYEEHRRDSSLLKLRWLRLVVDEGHELGMHETGSQVTHFINEIAAERRWVMSGTPTTGDEDDKDYAADSLDQLQRLMFFLRHPVYGLFPAAIVEKSPYVDQTENDSEDGAIAKGKWEEQVKLPFLGRKKGGREKLIQCLNNNMVMHRKEDISLHMPIFKQSHVDVPVPTEIQDKIIAKHNSSEHLKFLLNKYLHDHAFQSLVDESQAKHILKTVTAARRAGLDEHHRPTKAVIYSSLNNNLLSVSEPIIQTLGHESVAELYDTANAGDTSSELARFRNEYKEYKTCPICHREIDIIASNRGNKCKNYLLEVVTIEGTHRRRYLIEPERIVRTIGVNATRLGGQPLSNYSKLSRFWRVGDVLQVDIRDPHPILTARMSEDEWEWFGKDRCIQLAEKDDFGGRDWYFGPFEGAEENVECRLVKWQFCSRFHRRSWYRGPRPSEAIVQRKKEDCFILALHAGLSHGLDLSFVTHMFLLEAIPDASVLEQVTSRAHRLGATGPVIVDTVHTSFVANDEVNEKLSCTEMNVDIIKRDKEKALRKDVCQHCFREFDDKATAEEHERTNCPRNPLCDLAVDQFRLSSVYRQIKPPAPVEAVSLTNEQV